MPFTPVKNDGKPDFRLASPAVSREEFDGYCQKLEQGKLRRPTKEELDEMYEAIKALSVEDENGKIQP